jgi:type III restriction enzyme
MIRLLILLAQARREMVRIVHPRAVNPVVIVDEPQNVETDMRRTALLVLHPQCTLRYLATHRNPYNLLYSLNPVQAYDLGLVKQIEVDGVLADADHNQVGLELVAVCTHGRCAEGGEVRVTTKGYRWRRGGAGAALQVVADGWAC